MMADNRYDAIESSRSSLSPGNRAKGDDEYFMKPRSAESRKNLSSPRDSRHIDSGTTMDICTLSTSVYVSPSSNKESPKKANVMTEKEISTLVHSALIRARQATKSFSPKTRSYQSSPSPKVRDSPPLARDIPASLSQSSRHPISMPSTSSRGRPPVHSPTWTSPSTSRSSVHSSTSSPSRKTISVPTLNHTNEARHKSTNPRQAVRGVGAVGSIEEFHTPVSVSNDAISQLFRQSSLYTDDGGLEISESSTADQSASSATSTNSSDDIIKRVEEEIANARKAAREATRRLAGVSANFMAEVESGDSLSRNIDRSSSYNKRDNAVDIDTQLSMLASGTGSDSSSTDAEGNFDSALDVIGEEFDEKQDGVYTTIFDTEKNIEKIEEPVVAESRSNNKQADLRQSYVEEVDALELERLKSKLTEVDNYIVADTTKTTITSDEGAPLSIVADKKKENNTIDSSIATASDDDLAYDEMMSGFQQNGKMETIWKNRQDNDVEIKRKGSEKIQEEKSFTKTEFDSNGFDAHHIASNDKSDSKEKLIRIKSIGEYTLEYLPVDELKALLSERSGHSDSNDSAANKGIKTAVSIKKSVDNSCVPVDELEAVLSDEREHDKFQETSEVEIAECASHTQDGVEVVKDTPNPDDQETSIAQDGKSEKEQPKTTLKVVEGESLFLAKEMSNNIKLNDLGKSSDDEENQESTDTTQRDHQELPAFHQVTINEEMKPTRVSDENARVQTISSLCVSRSLGKETAKLGKIVFVDIEETEKVIKEMDVDLPHASFDDAEPEGKYTDSKENESLTDIVPEIKSSTVLIGCNSEVVDEIINRENADGKSSEEGEKMVGIDKEVSGTAMIENVATEIINNRNPLSEQLLSNSSIQGNENAPPIDPTKSPTQMSQSEYTSRLKESINEPSTSKTEDSSDMFDDTGDSSHEKKVIFKQRYPIPQKMKKFRQPSEIIFDYRLDKPSDKLWYSMPKDDLKELLEAVTGSSIQRRSNACGALKVLSTQTKNQLTLVRTQGFMDALVFAINEKNYLKRDINARIVARTRAVHTVLNVTAKKENRYYILLHPGLRESIVQCIVEDKAEARELACAVLATLAKSQHCRELMVKTEELVHTLALVLKRDDSLMFDDDHQSYVSEKVDYSGDDELSHEISNTFSSSSGSSSSSNSYFEVVSVETQKEDLEMGHRTRMNSCAALLHLSKECTVSHELCASSTLLDSLVSCCTEVENPIHTKCLEILANLSRFPHNNVCLVKYPGLVDALLMTGSQEDDTDRLWSMRIFQNLSSEPSAKARLANSMTLELFSTNMMRKQYGEQLAAASTVYNISTEPGAVVPLTNTKNVVATLVHIGHNPSSSMKVRKIVCDTLATLGLWLQTLASSGRVPKGMKVVALPSYITSGWQRWDE